MNDPVLIALQEETKKYRRWLRQLLDGYSGSVSNTIASWWLTEQAIMAAEDADRTARRDARRTELQGKIDALQAELDALT